MVVMTSYYKAEQISALYPSAPFSAGRGCRTGPTSGRDQNPGILVGPTSSCYARIALRLAEDLPLAKYRHRAVVADRDHQSRGIVVAVASR